MSGITSGELPEDADLDAQPQEPEQRKEGK